jgi:hypothetical protein
MDLPTIDAAFGITIAIGLILGFSLAFVLFRENKVKSLGFAPNDLAEWMISERWANVFNQRNYVEWATEELKKLENTKKESQKEADRIELAVNEQVAKSDELRGKMQSANSKLGQQAQNLAFSNVMNNLGTLTEDTDTNNDLVAPYANRKRFLKAIINGEDQLSVEDIMNKSNTKGVIDNPHVETFKLISARWDSWNDEPGLQDKIIHEMLSVPKEEDN